MGAPMGQKLLTWDLSGIVAVMLAFFIVLAFHLFSDWSFERKLIMSVITPLIVSNFFVLFHPQCVKDSMHCCKVIVISATQVLLFSTAIAGRVYYGSDYHAEEIYPMLFRAFISVSIGFGFWLSHFPERTFLGKYKVVEMFLNSHVFWHLLVFVCEYNLYWACFKLNVNQLQA